MLSLLLLGNCSQVDAATSGNVGVDVDVAATISITLDKSTLSFDSDGFTQAAPQNVIVTARSSVNYALFGRALEFDHRTTTDVLPVSVLQYTTNASSYTPFTTSDVSMTTGIASASREHTVGIKPVIPLGTKDGVYDSTVTITIKAN